MCDIICATEDITSTLLHQVIIFMTSHPLQAWHHPPCIRHRTNCIFVITTSPLISHPLLSDITPTVSVSSHPLYQLYQTQCMDDITATICMTSYALSESPVETLEKALGLHFISKMGLTCLFPSSHTHLPCLHILLQISELKRQSNEAVVHFGHKIGSLVPGQNSISLDPPTHSPFTQALGLLVPEDAENHHPTQRKGVRVRPTRDPKGVWGSAGCDDIRERDMSDTPCLLGLLEMASGVYPSTSSWKWCCIWGILYFSGPNYMFPGFPPMLTW